MLSVIIPTLNEAVTIDSLLVQLRAQTDIDLEIIIADGGSRDDTREVAATRGTRVVTSAPGRGRQMNAGAAVASGAYLLFLHADSKLTHDRQLSEAVTYLGGFPGRVAGHFTLAFDTNDPLIAEALHFFEAKTVLNRQGTFNGDQGLLLRREDFRLLQGFATDYPFLEDQDFGNRFRDLGRFVTLPSTLITSARRFEQEGLRERIILNTLIMGMYHLKLDHFFEAAPGIYRDNAGADRLQLAPFIALAARCMFSDGSRRGLMRWFLTGRYTCRNLWQVFLWYGLKKGAPDRWLDRYDRYVAPVTDNILGHLIGTLVILAWFYRARWRYRAR